MGTLLNISILMESNQIDFLKDLAKKRGMTLSQLVRNMLPIGPKSYGKLQKIEEKWNLLK